MSVTNTNNQKLQKEIHLMVNHIIRELIVEFGKSKAEAMYLVKRTDVEKSLMKDPMGFHESPYNWALSVLTDNDDVEALEKHLYH
jgi:UDP-N-acetylglucosamine transferase subunit ALG13